MISIKHIYEFLIILIFLFIGTILEIFLKSPIPATILSMLFLVALLYFKIIDLKKIEKVSEFLLESITLFMTPLVIGVIDKFHFFNGKFLQIFLILFVSVVVSITITSFATSIIGYEIQVKLGLKFLSPMVTSSVLIILVLLFFKIPYSNYKIGADIITFFVAPATVVLAVPLYKNLEIIKKYFLPILLGCIVGISIGVIIGIFLCNIFGINKEIILSMLSKSVTSAIGYEISKKIGAITEIAMVFIVICGIIGYSVGELIFKIFKIDDKVAKGVALGSCSHVLGTAKAMEIGEIEGSIATVSISISGILAVILIPLIINFI